MLAQRTSGALLASAILATTIACSRDVPSSSIEAGRIAHASDQTPFYYYQGKRVHLEVDPGQLIVETDAVEVGAAVRDVIGPFGLRTSSVRPLSQKAKHWVLTIVPGTPVAAAAAAREALTRDPRFQFASVGYRVAGGGGNITLINRVAVEFKRGSTHRQIDSLASALGLTLEREAQPNSARFSYRFSYPPRGDPLSIAATLDQHELVAWADPDKISEVVRHLRPVDGYYKNQFYLTNPFSVVNGVRVDINPEPAWDLTLGGGTVAVIDDGVQATHPDFAGRVLAGHDLFGNDAPGCSDCATSPFGNDSHGTSVAGIIAAEHNGTCNPFGCSGGIAGIAPDASILPIRMFRNGAAASDCEIGDGIDFAWDIGGAAVISNSWGYAEGYPGNNCVTSAIVRAEADGRGGLGTVVVFAAGNTSQRSAGDIGSVTYPATLATVIAVGAINRSGALTDYSPEGAALDIVTPSGRNTGPCIGEVATTDLLGAPGCSDFTPRPTGSPDDVDYSDTFSGTSAAAPQVAGVAALLLAFDPTLTAAQARARIGDGADPWGPSTQFGRGKLNAYRTLVP